MFVINKAMEDLMKELIKVTRKNTFYTGSGSLLALLALVIGLFALIK